MRREHFTAFLSKEQHCRQVKESRDPNRQDQTPKSSDIGVTLRAWASPTCSRTESGRATPCGVTVRKSKARKLLFSLWQAEVANVN